MAEIRKFVRSRPDAATGEESDFELVRQFQSSGDPAAFEAIFRRHQQHIANLCLCILRSRADAEDALQEVFLKAYRGMSRFEATVTLRGWLHRIAVNHCRDILERRRRLAEERDDCLQSVTSHPHDDSGLVEGMAIEAALDRLDPQYRIAFVLSAVEGHTIAEVAERSGIGIEAAASRIRRAYQHFSDAYRSLSRRRSC